MHIPRSTATVRSHVSFTSSLGRDFTNDHPKCPVEFCTNRCVSKADPFLFTHLTLFLNVRCRFPQIIQYIDMVNPDSVYSSYSTPQGGLYPLLTADQFGEDDEAGHGTHTAGSAAGATLNSPAETLTCSGTESLSCVGACIDGTDDDLVTFYVQYYSGLLGADLDRLCPMYGCDDATEPCLTDDVSETLTANGGVAQGAKLSIFDVFFDDVALIDSLGNDVWEPCSEAGCRLHSSSLGADAECAVLPWDVFYDEYMYQVMS